MPASPAPALPRVPAAGLSESARVAPIYVPAAIPVAGGVQGPVLAATRAHQGSVRRKEL